MLLAHFVHLFTPQMRPCALVPLPQPQLLVARAWPARHRALFPRSIDVALWLVCPSLRSDAPKTSFRTLICRICSEELRFLLVFSLIQIFSLGDSLISVQNKCTLETSSHRQTVVPFESSWFLFSTLISWKIWIFFLMCQPILLNVTNNKRKPVLST